MSLNPFIFRAGVQAKEAGLVVVFGAVLIPLSSGLVFRPDSVIGAMMASS